MPNHKWGYAGKTSSGVKLWHCPTCLRTVQSTITPASDWCDEGAQPQTVGELLKQLAPQVASFEEAVKARVAALTPTEREALRQRFGIASDDLAPALDAVAKGYEAPPCVRCPTCAGSGPFEETTPGNSWQVRYTCRCGTRWKLLP